MRRQLLVIALVVLVAVIAVVSCTVKRVKDKKSVQVTEQQSSQKSTAKEDKSDTQETEKERLKRVKEEAKAAGYPEKVIALLSKNPETVDFVENYGEKKDAAPAETIEELKEGEIPCIQQWDERWGYAPYGSNIVAVSGCGPTCMSMIIAGLTGDATVTPAVMAAYGTENQYLDEDNNTYWSFMEEAGENWGVSCRGGHLSEEEVKQELEAGHPIICSVGPGDFTKSGHFIILTEYHDGEVKVCDPFNRANSEKQWVFAEIQEQIKAMWIYSVDKQ